MYCEDFDVPSTSTQDCSGDVMIVSTTGKEDLSDGNKYCGKGQFSINSETNKMVIGFFSTKNTKGGKFLCTLEVVEPTPTCDCGWRNTRRIVGGVDTGVNEFPMMVALVDLDASSIFCGGSIISRNYIVTAAHCLVSAELNNTGVLVGDWDISSGSDTPKAKIYNSQQFLIHPSFNITTFANDIALVKTTTPIVFSLEVGPACLPLLYTTTNFVGTNVIELGWGTLGFGYPPSDILQKVDLRVISLNTCKETYSRVQNTQFCTYADNKDSCQGDSGGPALWQRNNTTRLQLLGIISTGNACAIRNIPGINTRVVSYIAWIRRNTPTESYCVFRMPLCMQIILLSSLILVQIISLDAITYDPDCNYYSQAELNQTYYVISPGYPKPYGQSRKCRWIIESPQNTIVQMYCEEFNVLSTSTQYCSGDVMIVSTEGKADLSDGDKYCGKGQFSINSKSNQLVVGFFSTANSTGGNFLCTLGVVDPTPTCDCGWRNTRRIVGGVDTGVNEYPMMAGLVDFEEVSVFCGSTIISRNYVLTAAHCLVNAELNNTGILVGDWNLNTGTDTPKSKIYNSAEFLIHRDFNSQTFENDIALVKTTKPIAFSLEVGPACLPILYQTTNFVGTYVTELGWGTLGFGYAPSDVLQKVDLRVISLEVCKQTYSSVQNRQFCTYTDNKDSCQGDSGGPALWQRNSSSRLQLLGIISTGNACAVRNVPGINTKVASYIRWIRTYTPGESYCSRP
ncbi:venom serine protease 34-like [Chrysoperla carnea]|uniref:venom serine protease 34-like n=1 Tax=Chrysoperla carnea TaxID=189513 RepID=UPI001D06F2D0|nr:venom serine protease 34-like [Chrysoperla carnea]